MEPRKYPVCPVITHILVENMGNHRADRVFPIAGTFRPSNRVAGESAASIHFAGDVQFRMSVSGEVTVS